MYYRCAAAALILLSWGGCGKPDRSPGPTGPAAPDVPAATAAEVDVQRLLEQAQQAARDGDLEIALDRVEQAIAADDQEPRKHLLMSQLLQMHGEKLAPRDRKTANQHFYRAAVEARRFGELTATPPTAQQRQVLSATFYNEACAFATDGQPENAMTSLRAAVDAGFSNLEMLAKDLDLGVLRDKPDFQQLVADARQRVLTQLRQEVRAEMAAQQPFDFSFSLPDLQGQTVALSDFQGKGVIVAFWGTWCPPCRMEIPHFIDLYNEYRDQGLEIVGINYEQVPPSDWNKTIRKLVQETGINYPCLIGDEATRSRVPRFQGFPTTLFVDRNGVVRLQLVGYHPKEMLEAAVLELLEEQADRA